MEIKKNIMHIKDGIYKKSDISDTAKENKPNKNSM